MIMIDSSSFYIAILLVLYFYYLCVTTLRFERSVTFGNSLSFLLWYVNQVVVADLYHFIQNSHSILYIGSSSTYHMRTLHILDVSIHITFFSYAASWHCQLR